MNRTTLARAMSRALLVFAFALVVSSAYAATVNVTCLNNAGDRILIQNALADNTVINLSGPCQLTAGLFIQNFTNVTIQSASFPTQVSLNLPVVACTATGPATVGVAVVDSRNVALRGLEIVGGADSILAQDSNVTLLHIIARSTRGEGILAVGSATINVQGITVAPGPTAQSTPTDIHDNCGNGVNANSGGIISIGQNVNIYNNGGSGIFTNGGHVNVVACCVLDTPGTVSIHDNLRGVSVGPAAGLNVASGSTCAAGTPGLVSINNNHEQGATVSGSSLVVLSGQVIFDGNNSAPATPLGLRYPGGLVADYDGSFLIGPGVQVKNSHGGPGVWLDVLSSARFGTLVGSLPASSPCVAPTFTGPTITTNDAEGLRIEHNSVGEVLQSSITGNKAKDDATCDATSQLFGDTSGIGKNKCK